MRKRLLILCGLALSLPLSGAEELKPGAMLRFEFPELPETLASVDSGKKQPAILSARLPDNYSPEGKFPIFIYLPGGPGGRGDIPDLNPGLIVIGKSDYVCVVMPLFKSRVDPAEPARGLMVSMDDFAVIASSYRVMLEKLLSAVPNIDTERSVLGGFSNGAHTTGVLLAGQDDFTLKTFRHFYLHEGGIGPLFANVLQKQSMKAPRFLIMMGGKGPFIKLTNTLQEMTSNGGRDFTYVTMEGYGHEQPPGYLKVIGQWVRGETLDTVPPKPEAPAQ